MRNNMLIAYGVPTFRESWQVRPWRRGVAVDVPAGLAAAAGGERVVSGSGETRVAGSQLDQACAIALGMCV